MAELDERVYERIQTLCAEGDTLASISTVAQTLLHPQAGFANPPVKLGIWGRIVSRLHD